MSTVAGLPTPGVVTAAPVTRAASERCTASRAAEARCEIAECIARPLTKPAHARIGALGPGLGPSGERAWEPGCIQKLIAVPHLSVACTA